MEGSLCALRTGLHNQPRQEEGIWPYRVVVLCGWAARNRGSPPFFAVRPDTLGHIGLCGGRERVPARGVGDGGVLLSHTLAGAVPSALAGLATGFGMGPGVSPPL